MQIKTTVEGILRVSITVKISSMTKDIYEGGKRTR